MSRIIFNSPKIYIFMKKYFIYKYIKYKTNFIIIQFQKKNNK